MKTTTPTPEFPLADLTITMMREVFQAISASSLEQAQAYVELAGELGVPVEDYVNKLIGGTPAEQMANVRGYLAEVVLPMLTLPSSPVPNPILFGSAGREALREHFHGIVAVAGTTQALSLIDGVISSVGPLASIARTDLEAFALSKLRTEAANTYHRLSGLLRSGMPNVEVTGGKICMKVTMRVSSEQQVKSQSLALGARPGQVGLRVRLADERTATLARSTEVIGSISIDFVKSKFPPLKITNSAG